MKKILVLTANRAEYGLLSPVIKELNRYKEFDVEIVVTGAHLSPEFGMTVSEIEADNVKIEKKIEILLSADTPTAISKTMGLAMISFADYFQTSCPDALLVLGDRYETLSVCCVAMNARIPIFHMCGGETTEGAIDEAIRHAITKMSFLHFTTTEEYKKRVIQLGESPDRVFNVGSPGVENALNTQLLSKEELEKSLGFDLGKKYAVATFHPVTLENNSAKTQTEELLKAISTFPEIKFLFTKANSDTDGRIINEKISEYSKKEKNLILVDSLGMRRYLSAISRAEFVIGNSSSGIGEVPVFHVPTINIGDRQRGRIQSESIINCGATCNDIEEAIKKVMDEEFKKKIIDAKNPYGDGYTSKKVGKIIYEYLINKGVEIKKKFYDIY